MTGIAPVRRVRTAAGLLWRGDSVLCCLRPDGKAFAGFWEFPGGKVREGETPGDALARELREELGVTPARVLLWKNFTYLYRDRGLEVDLFLFHVPGFAGEPVPLEGQTLRWVRHDLVPDLTFLEANREAVRDLLPPERRYTV